MPDGRKSKRWIRSLGEAGFLDEIDDGWTIPDQASERDASIVVDGEGDPPPEPDLSPGPLVHRGMLSFPPDEGADEQPRTPVERGRFAQRSTPPVPMRGDHRAREADGLPPATLEPPARDPGAPRRERLPASPGVQRITVPPVPIQEDFGGVGTIEEELPRGDGARQQMRETVRPGRRSGVSGHGAEAAPAPHRMTELAEVGDFSGALALAEEILCDDPDDAEARRMRERCREVLLQMYESRLGPLDRTPRLAVAENELVWRSLDPVSGFVLSRVDGFSSFEDIIDISSLPRFETCRILDRLLQDGLLRVDR